MVFDSEKWALSFYGIIDEHFAVDSELLKLHIHRKESIRKIQVERDLGNLDIYIPTNWEMETYQNQEKLRKVMSAEVKWQALNIFSRRTNLIANSIGLPNLKVSVCVIGHFMGKCYYMENHIKYNQWTICYPKKEYVDLLICHELAHFYQHNHSEQFWDKLEHIYLGLEDNMRCTRETFQQLSDERRTNKTVFLLRYWGRQSYLKDFFDKDFVKHKTPLITPIYKDTSEGKVEIAYSSNFEIRFWQG